MENPSHSFILLVGDESALLLPPQHLPDADPLFTTSHDDDEAEAVLDTIAMAPHLPVMILNDCSDQQYSRETTPELSTLDRKKLLDRKIKEAFPNAAFRTAIPQRENKALMVGINETEPLKLWQDRLSKIPNDTGIVSQLPLESADMLSALWPEAKEGWCLLLSFHATGGTRQIVTYNGEIVFTRLTAPMAEGTSVGYMSATIAIDIKATRDYLLRMGYSNEMPFHLIAIMPPNMLASMQATPLDVSSRHFFTPHEAALKLNLPLAPEKNETISDLIHALWYARRSEPKVLLAKASTLKEIKQIKVHKIGMTTAVIFSLIAGVMIGQVTLHYLKNHRTVYEIQHDIDQLEASFKKQQTKITTATEPIERLRMAVERKRLFAHKEPQPLTILRAIQSDLGDDMRLQKIHWRDNALHFTLRLTDEELLKKPISLNKAEITKRFAAIELTMRGNLLQHGTENKLTLISNSLDAAANQTRSSETETDQLILPTATYKIEWRGK